MRTVIQRVSHASVAIGGQCKSAIGQGMLILLGIEETDTEEDIAWLTRKIVGLRIFDDADTEANLVCKLEIVFLSDILLASFFLRFPFASLAQYSSYTYLYSLFNVTLLYILKCYSNYS